MWDKIHIHILASAELWNAFLHRMRAVNLVPYFSPFPCTYWHVSIVFRQTWKRTWTYPLRWKMRSYRPFWNLTMFTAIGMVRARTTGNMCYHFPVNVTLWTAIHLTHGPIRKATVHLKCNGRVCRGEWRAQDWGISTDLDIKIKARKVLGLLKSIEDKSVNCVL